jgi:hypothetical protein
VPKPQPEQKTVNMVTNARDGTSGYGNLPYVLSVFQSTTWWSYSGANVHMCSDVSLFSSYQVTWDSFVMMGNGSHASVYGVGIIDLKLTCNPTFYKNKIFVHIGVHIKMHIKL